MQSVVSSNPFRPDILDTTLCDKVCHWHGTEWGRKVSQRNTVSPANKNWLPQYKWNIAEIGCSHPNPNPLYWFKEKYNLQYLGGGVCFKVICCHNFLRFLGGFFSFFFFVKISYWIVLNRNWFLKLSTSTWEFDYRRLSYFHLMSFYMSIRHRQHTISL